MKKIVFLLGICCLTFSFNGFAQASLSNLNGSFEYVSDSTTLSQLDSSLLAMEERTLSISVNCSGSGIAKLAVSVGSAEGSNDVFYKEFDYGQTGTFGDGTSYSSSGSNHTVSVGNYAGFSDYYLEVKALLSNGDEGGSVRGSIN